MPYIGRDLNRGNYLKLDDISSSFNSSTKTFDLKVGGSAFTPGSAFSILVSVGGVIQEPESAYQVNNSQITFANAPTAQDGFFCIALGVSLGIGVPGSGTVNGPQMAKPFNYDGFFYLNDANNRVGINSSIPTASLDVIGNIKLNGNLVTGSGTGALQGNVYAASGISTFNDVRITNNLTVEGTTTTLDTNLIGVDRVEVGANSNTLAGIAVTQSGSADLVRLYDGASQVVTVDDTGNVGIGTGVPNTNLHIVSSNPVVRLQDSDNSQYSAVGGESGNLYLYTATNSRHFIFRRNSPSAEIARITGDGKLGIGTHTPDHSLHILKEGGDSVITIESTGNGNHSALAFRRTSSTGNDKGAGSIYVTGDTSTSAAKMQFGVAYNIGHGTHSRMTIEGVHGRVGIGTDSPTDILDVYSATDPTIRSRSGSSSVGALMEICGGSSNDSTLVLSSGTTKKYQIFRDGSQSDDLRIYDTTNTLDIMRYRHGGYLHFGVNGQERLRIKSDGRVGVGTDSPLSVLTAYGENRGEGTVTGQITAKDNAAYNASPTAGIVFQGHYASNNAQAIFAGITGFKENANDANYAGALAFHVRNNGAVAYEALRIRSDGNVGIATANPTNRLNVVDGGIKVHGAATPNINFSPYGGNAGNGDISFDGTDLKIISNSSGANIRIGAYSKLNHIVIKANGHIGIHTDNPSNSQHLTVAGKSNYEAGIHYQQSNVSLYRFMTEGGTGNVYYDVYGISGANGDHVFRTKVSTGAQERLRITEDGLVGINTSVPTAQLSFLAKRTTQTYPPICFQTSYGSSLADAAISTTDDTGGTDIMMGSNVYMGQNGTFVRYASVRGSAAVRCQYTGNTIFYNKSGNNAPAESMRIDGDGHLHTGYTSSFGQDHVNILASDGGGISIAQNNSGNATAGTVLGSLSIQGYLNTQTYANAEVKISGIAAADHTGSSAATDMVFYTKPSSTGPGSAPTEALRITSAGNVGIGLTNPSKSLEIQHVNNRKLQFSYDDSIITMKGANNNGNPETIRLIGGNSIRFHTGATGSGDERVRITTDGELLIPGTQTVSDQTGMLDIYHTSPAEIDSPHIRLWGPTNQDARIEFGSETNSGEGGYISYNDSDEGLYIGSRMSGYSEVNICTGMNDGSPHSNVRLAVNNYGRTRHQNTTDFNREAYTAGGTVHGGGDATGKDNVNPGAYTFVNSTSVRGANTRYSFWVQSGDAYPNASNYLDFTVANAAMYRVIVKGSNSSDTADVAQFLIYGLANNDGQRPPVIEQVTTSPPSFNGDSGSYSPDFHRNSGSFSCIVKGFGSSGGTRGSTGTYDTTLRIQYSGNYNQGLVAFIERWDSGT